MLSLGPLAFTAPWLLLALVLLPILWLLLRAVPPAPVRRRFPGVALLLGLRDEETQADTTPWWLLLLRALAVGLVILGLAGPILNPEEGAPGSGPVLILADGTWADAPSWPARLGRIEDELDRAARAGRPAAVALATDLPPGGPEFRAASDLLRALPGLTPAPHAPDPVAVSDWAEGLEGAFETLWLSDGLARPSRDDLLTALRALGPVRVFEGGRPVTALRPPAVEDGAIALAATRAVPGPAREARVIARGPGPDGVERVLAEADLAFEDGEAEAEAAIALPPELRNRVARFEIEGLRSAGAVQMVDDALRRREIALVSGEGEAEGLRLLSPLHYLREALAPTADLIEGDVMDALPANPDVIVLADVGELPEAEALAEWVEEGGLLLRFAGPRLAASDAGRGEDDPLMPVSLRAGGRSVGGAMSWGEPKALEPFPDDGPFAGLAVPEEVRVSAQVLAEPGPELAERTLARLADGTPLVTRRELGAGQVVLFHVTANAEWSGLPLSGLFVRMLERLAVSAPAAGEAAEELDGTVWAPEVLLDAFGVPREAGEMPGVEGEALMEGASGAAPPGLYSDGDRMLALNVIGADTALEPAAWPADVPVEGPTAARETPLGGWLLAAAVALLAADVIASLLLMGRLRGGGGGADRSAGAIRTGVRARTGGSFRRGGAARGGGAAALLALLLLAPGAAEAQALARDMIAVPGWWAILAMAGIGLLGLAFTGEARRHRLRIGRIACFLVVGAVLTSAVVGSPAGGGIEGPLGQPPSSSVAWCLPSIVCDVLGQQPITHEPRILLAVAGTSSDLLLLVVLAALALAPRRAAPLLLALGLAFPLHAQEGDDAAAVAAASSEVTLAHVLTGEAQVDEMARAGLQGLSSTLYRRTSVEPAEPVGVDPETDELSVYPLLYWPVTPDQAVPSEAAYAKLNRYLRSGGMILFDTRDANLPGSSTPEARTLQRIASALDVPPLEVVPADHVLTRSFYLLQDFPGRHASREVWVEAAPPDAELAEGMPFRNLNDGVTPVVIGGNDWAAAWAEDAQGRAVVPIGRGYAGERQREIALRFGVNLVMHVLTGNYKSDQVHVPALLDRLGQ